MKILLYKNRFNRRYDAYDRLQMDRLHEVLGGGITVQSSDDEALLRSAEVVIFNLPRLPFRMDDYAAMRAAREPWQVWVNKSEVQKD